MTLDHPSKVYYTHISRLGKSILWSYCLVCACNVSLPFLSEIKTSFSKGCHSLSLGECLWNEKRCDQHDCVKTGTQQCAYDLFNPTWLNMGSNQLVWKSYWITYGHVYLCFFIYLNGKLLSSKCPVYWWLHPIFLFKDGNVDGAM